MDPRDALLDQLKATERHLATAREHIAHERELLAELEDENHRAAAVRVGELLKSSLETQKLHEWDRERILLALDGKHPVPVRPAAIDGLSAADCLARADNCRAAAIGSNSATPATISTRCTCIGTVSSL
jgi:hypothetical protein